MTTSNLHAVVTDAVANAGPDDSIAAALRRAVIDRAAGEPIVVLGVACAPVDADESGDACWEGYTDGACVEVDYWRDSPTDRCWCVTLYVLREDDGEGCDDVIIDGYGETRDAAVRDLRAKRDELVRRLIGSEIGRALGAMHGGGR